MMTCITFHFGLPWLVSNFHDVYELPFQNRPGYILPFFCLQVFDFSLSCLSIVGYLSYSPNIKLWLRAQGLVSGSTQQDYLKILAVLLCQNFEIYSCIFITSTGIHIQLSLISLNVKGLFSHDSEMCTCIFHFILALGEYNLITLQKLVSDMCAWPEAPDGNGLSVVDASLSAGLCPLPLHQGKLVQVE